MAYQVDKEMREKFIEQTGLTGDVFEYGDASRSKVDTMFFTGADPWHRIGTKLDNPATAEEAIVAAGLDWEVEPVETYIWDRNGTNNGKPTGDYAIVRTDNSAIFTSGLSSRYSPCRTAMLSSFLMLLLALVKRFTIPLAH